MKTTGKKLLALLLSALMLAAVLCGCGGQNSSSSPASDSSAAGPVGGTYTGTAEGFGGEVSVTVTIEGGAITAVDAAGDSETATIGGAALPELAQAILDAQSPDIDGVAGATVTSTAVMAAAKDALTQAGMSFEETAEPTGEDEEVTTDVLVIGMGASGTMAALSAAEAGAQVLGVESTGVLGGMGNAAQGMFAIGTSLQEERYGDDLGSDEEYWYEKIMDQGNQLANAQLVRTFVSEAKNTVEYLLDKGVNVYLSKTDQQIAHFDETIIYHRWNNADPFTYLGQSLEENGVEIRYNTTATSLLTDDSGAVTGAVCTKEDGSTLTVHAGSVIVATGSFAGNEEMMRETLGDKVYDTVSVIGGNDGSGLQMMYDVGAAKGKLLTMNHGVGTKTADITSEQLTLNTPVLWVNQLGQRFMNEDLLKDTVEFSSAVLAQGGYAFTIVDQATVDRWTDMTQENTGTWVHYWDRFGIVDENGDPTVYHAPIDPEVFAADFEALTASGDGKVCQTLDEVAEFIGCDPDTLKETVERYNTYVETGVDEEFFKSAESLVYAASEAPYYVTKGYNAVLGALGGVDVTSELQVVDENMQPITGLYATGNNCSGISVAAYVNVEGVGLGFALTSGRLAGTHAAEAALAG